MVWPCERSHHYYLSFFETLHHYYLDWLIFVVCPSQMEWWMDYVNNSFWTNKPTNLENPKKFLPSVSHKGQHKNPHSTDKFVLCSHQFHWWNANKSFFYVPIHSASMFASHLTPKQCSYFLSQSQQPKPQSEDSLVLRFIKWWWGVFFLKKNWGSNRFVI